MIVILIMGIPLGLMFRALDIGVNAISQLRILKHLFLGGDTLCYIYGCFSCKMYTKIDCKSYSAHHHE